MSATAQQVAFATGKRRPSGTFLPPAEHVCAGGALGRRPPVEPHPFIARCAADASAAAAASCSAALQLRTELRRADAELDAGRAAEAHAILEAARVALNGTEQPVPAVVVAQLHLSLGCSCAAQARHDEALRWFERSAKSLGGASAAERGRSLIVPVVNQALQLAELGRHRAAVQALQRASRQLEETALGMPAPALLALRAQLLLAQAACARAQAQQARAAAHAGAGAGAASSSGAAEAGAAVDPLARVLKLLGDCGQIDTSGVKAEGGCRAEMARATALDALGHESLTRLAEQLQAAATLMREGGASTRRGGGSGGAGGGGGGGDKCHEAALSLLRRARDRLLEEVHRRKAARGAAYHPHPHPPHHPHHHHHPPPRMGGEAALLVELAHVCGRLAYSNFALRRQEEGTSWLHEAARLMQRLPLAAVARPGGGVGVVGGGGGGTAAAYQPKAARLAQQDRVRQHFEEAHAGGPLAMAKACGDFLAGRVAVAVASDQNDR